MVPFTSHPPEESLSKFLWLSMQCLFSQDKLYTRLTVTALTPDLCRAECAVSIESTFQYFYPRTFDNPCVARVATLLSRVVDTRNRCRESTVLNRSSQTAVLWKPTALDRQTDPVRLMSYDNTLWEADLSLVRICSGQTAPSPVRIYVGDRRILLVILFYPF